MRTHLALVTALLAALATGCAPKNTASVQPFALCAMPDDCKFSSTCTANSIGALTLDLAYGAPMWLAVEMHNQLSANADEDSGRVNTHDAHFESYSLEFGGVRAGVAPTTIADLPPSGANVQQLIPADGTAVIGFEPIPLDLVAALRASGVPAGPDYDEVSVKVTFKGRYDDGSSWEAPYTVPVRLCTNCVGAVCSDAAQTPISACPSLAQLPRGEPKCTAPTLMCLASGTFCGGNPNVVSGVTGTSYACLSAGAAPANSTACGAAGCDMSTGTCN